MTGEARGCSRAAAPVCGFSRGTTARAVSLSWGGKEVGSPCEWRGGARLYSQVTPLVNYPARRIGVKLGRIRARESAHISGKLDYQRLHPKTNSEVRYLE